MRIGPRRLGIGAKLTGIYLIIALPLIAALSVSFAFRYQERVTRVLLEREELARIAAGTFVAETEALGTTMRYVGRHIIDERRGPVEASRELATLSENYPVSFAVLLVEEGRVLHSDAPEWQGRDLSARRDVEEVLSGGRSLQLSPVREEDGLTGYWVTQAVPRRVEGARAAVSAFIALRGLQRRPFGSTEGEGTAHVVDSNGRLVFSTDDPSAWRDAPDWSGAAFVQSALDGESVAGTYDDPVTGEEVLVSEVPIEDFGWAAGSSVTRASAVAALREQFLLVGAALVAVQLIVLGVVFWLSRRLVGPLAHLVEQSAAVGEGRFDQAIQARTGDEIESLAVAMDQTRRKLRRYVEGQSALAQNGRALAAMVTEEGLDRTVISGATELFGATEVWILVEEEGRLAPRLLHGTDLDAAQLGHPPADEGMLGEVVSSGTGRIIPDVRDLPPSEWARRAAARDVRSVALLPLRSRTATYGVLGIAAPQVMPWSSETRERELLELFAGQVADALENVRLFERVRRLAEDNERLYERERDSALRLQESLLRMPSTMPGVRFRHLYRSAMEATLVGGDFYDLFEIGNDRLGVAVGDVSGKGLEAATLISFVKSSLRAYAYEGHPPAEVLSSINDAVDRLTQAHEFVTVFFGIYDCRSGRLVYCSAGHPPSLIRRQAKGDGTVRVEVLPTGSPLLGAFGTVKFEDGETCLEPGDTLLLYTDGVTEARPPGGPLFGVERLVDVVRAADEDADLTAVVFDAATGYARGRLSDDIAMLALTPDVSRTCA